MFHLAAEAVAAAEVEVLAEAAAAEEDAEDPHHHPHVEEDAEEVAVSAEAVEAEVAAAEDPHHPHHAEEAAQSEEDVEVEVEAVAVMPLLHNNLMVEAAVEVTHKPQLLPQLQSTAQAQSEEAVAVTQPEEAVAAVMLAHKSPQLVATATLDASKDTHPYAPISHSLISNIISVRFQFFNDCAFGASTHKSKSRFLHLLSSLLIFSLLLFSPISLFSPTTTTPNCLYIFVDHDDVGLKKKKYKEF